MRFAIDVYEAVRSVWPSELPIGIRVSATDWIDGGWSVEETVDLLVCSIPEAVTTSMYQVGG